MIILHSHLQPQLKNELFISYTSQRYGYSWDSYYEALKELEARFGKPSLVVKVTLDRLRKTSRMKNDRPHELMEVLDL